MRVTALLLSVTCAVLTGCSVSSEDDGLQTDRSEAGTVRDIRARFTQGGKTYRSVLRDCEREAIVGPTFEACAEQDAYPFYDSLVRDTERGLRELVPDVGPECRRALRAAASGVGDAFTARELLNRAVRVCGDEAR